MGCVSQKRYDQTLRIRSALEDGIKLLSSVSKSMYRWKKLLGLKTSKNPDYKTFVYYTLKLLIISLFEVKYEIY